MRNLRIEKEIMAQWQGDPSQPMVSVCCITYNHEPYIEDALEGFLIQETDFSFEILIHDDASTDRTADIIREYEQAYPKIIKPIYQTKNQYSQGEKPGLINMSRAKGKYIALCEGDDYWTDPLKLQRQVEFLENNKEYGLVHTKTTVYNQSRKKLYGEEIGDINNSFIDFLKKNRIATLTVLFKRNLYLKYHEEIQPQKQNWKMGDYPMWLWFAKNSKIQMLPDVTAVRRLVKGSASNQTNIHKSIEFTRSLIEIKHFFIQKYGCSESELWKINALNADIKIKKGILVKSYDFYKEGIIEKKMLGHNITAMEKLYGLLIKNTILKKILSFFLLFRKYSV